VTYTIVTMRNTSTGNWKWLLYEGDHAWPESLIETGHSVYKSRWGARRAARKAARRRAAPWGSEATETYTVATETYTVRGSTVSALEEQREGPRAPK
jgi:hypothetical protein